MTPRCVHGVPTDRHCETCDHSALYNEPAAVPISSMSTADDSIRFSPHRIQSTADEPATGQVSPKTQVEGSRATNPPSAPAAGPDAPSGEVSLPWSKRVIETGRLVPDAQTPLVDALDNKIKTNPPSDAPTPYRASEYESMAKLARSLERANTALRKCLEVSERYGHDEHLRLIEAWKDNADLRRQLAEAREELRNAR